MNHLTQVFSTANRLQASRSILRDLRGLDKTPEGEAFAKAIGNAAACGATAEDIAAEVIKAMGGNQDLALHVLGSVQELAKAHVEHHTRTVGGKTVDVKAYETARTAAMKQTTQAHGATFQAMRSKTPEAHENAAAAHTEAAKMHGEAHEHRPDGDEEAGIEHAKLKGQHQVGADYHKGAAQEARNGEEYQKAKVKAETASNIASHVGTGAAAGERHTAAAEAHEKAEKLNPGQGHKEKAESHAAVASASHAFDSASESPVKTKARWDALDASGKALTATRSAHQDGEVDPKIHQQAAEAHGRAAEAHMELHGAHESDEEGHHGKIAKQHIDLHAYHSQKAAVKEEEPVAKSEVAAHTRTVDGKVQQVHAYQTVARAAAIPAKAHQHMLGLNSPWQGRAAKARDASQAASDASHGKDHTKAASAHLAAADAHEKVDTDGSRAIADEHRGLAKEHEAHAWGQHSGATWNHPDKAIAAESNAALNASSSVKTNAYNAKHAADNGEDRKGRKVSHAAYGASVNAHEATDSAHYQHGDHMAASDAHKEAAQSHEAAAEHHQYDGDKTIAATHKEAARMHEEVGRQHFQLGLKTKSITKAEGPMTAMDGGTDLAEKTGGAALTIEGRPDEKDRKKDDEEEVGKAHVGEHQRTQGGKVVQVSAYDTHQNTAHAFSAAAHKATSEVASHPGPEAHTGAAAAHSKAAEAHTETAKYAPEEWMKKGHEDQAALHGHYAKNHTAAAKAAGQKADTGVNSEQHTEEDIKHLEQHPDHQGFGYLGHSKRDSATDLALTQAANKAGISHHELAAHILSQSGRHMMDADEGHESEAQPKADFEAKHSRRVAHYQRWLTDPKNAKNYGIKDYAADLKSREIKQPKQGNPAAEGAKAAAAEGNPKAAAEAASTKASAASEKARVAGKNDHVAAHTTAANEHRAAAKAHEAAAKTAGPNAKGFHTGESERHTKVAGIHHEAANTAYKTPFQDYKGTGHD